MKYVILRNLAPAPIPGPFGTRLTVGNAAFGASFGMAGASIAGMAAAPPVVARIEEVEVDDSDRKDLMHSPDVLSLSPVMPVRLIAPVTVKGSGRARAKAGGTAWGVEAVGAKATTFTGAGVRVAVLDTGIDASHPAFTGVKITEEDFTGEGNGDQVGHGTHCAGTILGRDVEGMRIGVARGVTELLVGKVLGSQGGTSESVFRGIEWAANSGAQVVSMSLGFDFPAMVEQLAQDKWPISAATSMALEAYRGNLRMFDALMQVRRAQESFDGGVVIVAATGNESQRGGDPEYQIAASLPAAAEGVISVGALAKSNRRFAIASFSNTFPKVAAPGVDVISAKAGGGLVSMNGTSMATPHVAGVAALWWEAVRATRGLPPTASTVMSRLQATSRLDRLVDDPDATLYGQGLVAAP